MKSTLALSSAALLAVARAQEPIVVGDLAADVSDEAWASVSESANLTDSQTFTGRAIGEAYPGSAQDGWELSLALKDNLDAPDSDDLLTATTITLSSPDGEVSIDDSWRVCVHVFPVMSSSSSGWGHEFEPDCHGLVAQECIDDLGKQGIKKFGEGCPSWSITPSCLRDLEEQEGYSIVLSDEFIGNTSFYRSTAGTHAADDDTNTIYLEAAAVPLAVVNVFGASEESEDEPHVQVRCLLPDTVEGDSFDPAPDAAAGLSKFVGWAALTGAVAALQLVL